MTEHLDSVSSSSTQVEGSSSSLANAKQDKEITFLTESYREQSQKVWPGRGQIILAQFDDDYVVVYQGFNKKIADYAVANQRFVGCPEYNNTRMTWIKTNFAWAAWRSGWASKHNQEHMLAIWLRRSAFEMYLENARRKGSTGLGCSVRLQWDPDHLPNGDPHVYRRAVQLGLKGVKGFADGADILKIEDITEFVRSQATLTVDGKSEHLIVARERVFIPTSLSAEAQSHLNLSEVKE
jgi:hypothetical protein